MYAIHKFLQETMKQKKLSKKELARRLGYNNISKGIRRIDEFLEKATLNEHIIYNLHSALDEPKAKILEKLEETKEEIALEIHKQEEEKKQKEKEERKNFKPFLYCVTEKPKPWPIFISALTQSYLLKKVNLPNNFNELSHEQKQNAMKDVIKEHYNFIQQRWSGIIPAYGKILAYTFVPTYDYNEEDLPVYTIDGTLIESPPRFYQNIELGVSYLETKEGKDITRFFKNVEFIIEEMQR
jgi:transcriptional regulator with XRE-family HTH domain